jgi:hypothetical protein
MTEAKECPDVTIIVSYLRHNIKVSERLDDNDDVVYTSSHNLHSTVYDGLGLAFDSIIADLSPYFDGRLPLVERIPKLTIVVRDNTGPATYHFIAVWSEDANDYFVMRVRSDFTAITIESLQEINKVIAGHCLTINKNDHLNAKAAAELVDMCIKEFKDEE